MLSILFIALFTVFEDDNAARLDKKLILICTYFFFMLLIRFLSMALLLDWTEQLIFLHNVDKKEVKIFEKSAILTHVTIFEHDNVGRNNKF